MKDKMNKDIIELFQRYKDGELNSEEFKDLEILLNESSEARQLWFEFNDLEHFLEEHTTSTGLVGKLNPDYEPKEDPQRTNSRFLRLKFFSIASSLIILVLLGILLYPKVSHQDDPATLVQGLNTVFKSGKNYKKGDSISKGQIELVSGTATLRFKNDTKITLQGKTQLEIISSSQVKLNEGKVLVEANSDFQSFSIKTQDADFIDVGTSFGLLAQPGSGTEVHVFDGTVLARPKIGTEVLPILKMEAGQVDQEASSLLSIRIDPQKFGLENIATKPAKIPLASKPFPPSSRILFLGDKTTDRETHILLLEKALARTDYPLYFFNAGVSFPLSYTEAEFKELIRTFNPSHVVLSFGAEIAIEPKPRSQEKFESDIQKLVNQLDEKNINIIIQTGHPLGTPFKDALSRLRNYNLFLRDFSFKNKIKLIDIHQHLLSKNEEGLQILAPDGNTPTYEAHREMAACFLESFNIQRSYLPESLRFNALPGIVPRWEIRTLTRSERLNSLPDKIFESEEAWETLRLPIQDSFSKRISNPGHTIMYRDRLRGFATHLVRDSKLFVQGRTVLHSDKERSVWLNTGATLWTVWLNGEKVYDNKTKWSGWHAGKERVPVQLKSGENRIIIEALDSFFLSFTDEQDWALTSAPNIGS